MRKERKKVLLGILVLMLVFYWFSLPRPLFLSPTSTVMTDRYGDLLGAKIADDGQWRFPQIKTVPEKFEKAIIQFEDRKFYKHPGVNPFSLVRAFIQNFKHHKVRSGGSTLSMQVIRLSRKNQPRTFFEKFIEIILATRLEISYSKKDILKYYASNAPFGGNVVGLEAASWRYFGRGLDKLSWAEITALAVLPNSPALIYPGKNHYKLKLKRDRLLNRLRDAKIIDVESCNLAKQEPTPVKPYQLPQITPHLLDKAVKDGFKGEQLKTSINKQLQEQVTQIIEAHHKELLSNEVNNAATLVLDVKTGEVLAYVGNTFNPDDHDAASDVDIINAPRSTGSILKPYLYAAMLNDGLLLPGTLIPDIPTDVMGYAPKNFNLTYDGAVPARRALARSLNVPAVRLLNTYGVNRFHFYLKKLGMTTLTKPAKHYGLTLILGGAEGKLWELAGIYASMSRTLLNYTSNSDNYFTNNFHPPVYLLNDEKVKKNEICETSVLDASSIWLTFEAMVEVARPDEDLEWRQFSSSSKIAWKTGTSFGNRDAWAIGCTPRYVVAVWVGNADGEGRPGLTGISNAAPILFDIFKLFKPMGWFSQPYDDMVAIPVCHYSGYRATANCEQVDTLWVQKKGIRTSACPYHQIVHLDITGRFRVSSECEKVENMKHVPWFVLPPVMEYYFKSKNPFYKELPPYRSDCAMFKAPVNSMEIIYPKEMSKIYVPIELDENIGKTVFKVAHRNADMTIYWHIDNEYVGLTKGIHQMGFTPEPGKHILTLVDQNGETLSRSFEILGKK